VKLDLNELLEHRVVDEETAQRIRTYYQHKSTESRSSRFLLILSLIGVVLVGLGLILIIAYNWEDFPKWSKIAVAFLPLLATQVSGVFVLRNKPEKMLWTESISLAILFALGLAISLLSQIYHIEADISGFLKWWIILAAALPIIFQSRSVSLGLWIGMGWYLTTIPWSQNQVYDFFPLLIILGLWIWYVNQWKNGLNQNLLILHHWAIPIVLTIFLFYNSGQLCERLVIPACLILFLAFTAIAFGPFSGQRILSNGYRVAQFLGIWIVGMIMTFDFFWSGNKTGELLNCFFSHNFIGPAILLLTGGLLTWYYFKKRITLEPDNMVWLGISLIPVLIIGDFSPPTGQWIANLVVVSAAAKLIYDGVTGESLLVVNMGLLALTVWVLAWFFGHDFSFIWKGMLFIALGLLCFGINAMIIKKQKR